MSKEKKVLPSFLKTAWSKELPFTIASSALFLTPFIARSLETVTLRLWEVAIESSSIDVPTFIFPPGSPAAVIWYTIAYLFELETLFPAELVILSSIKLPKSSLPLMVNATLLFPASAKICTVLFSSAASCCVIVNGLFEWTKISPVVITSWLLFVVIFKPGEVKSGIGVVIVTLFKSSDWLFKL